MALASVSAVVDVVNMSLQRLGQPTVATMTESSRDASIANQLYAQNRDYCLLLTDWDCLIKRQTMTRSGKITISAATAASPVHLTVSGHTYIANELVTVEDAGGMTQLNNNIYRVFAAGADTMTLYATDGTALDGSGFTAYTSGGSLYRYPGNDFSYAYDLPTDCLRVVKVLDETFGYDTARSIDGNRWKERTFVYTDLENAGLMYLKQETDPSLYEPDLVEVIVARLTWFIAMRIHADKTLREQCLKEFQGATARAKLTNATGSGDEGEPAKLWAKVR